MRCADRRVPRGGGAAVRYIKLEMAGEGQYGSSIYEIKAFDGNGAPIRINSALASAEDGSGYGAVNVFDGDLSNTRWSGNAGPGHQQLRVSATPAGRAQPAKPTRVPSGTAARMVAVPP